MRLTDNQASVYRAVREEELDAGASEDEANREAYRFMREDALPEWGENVAAVLQAVTGSDERG